MTNYNTNLKTWGDVGEEYPDGYNQTGGVAPVDEWHDFLFYNLIDDVKHLVGLTNGRLDSASSAAFPSSPTDGNLVHRSDENLLYYYNTDTTIWTALAKKSTVDNHTGASNNPHGVTAAQAGAIADSAGTVDMSHLSFNPATQLELDNHEAASNNPHGVTAAQVGSYTTTQADAAFSAAGHTHDSRYYTESEIDSMLSGTAVSGHNHDTRYYQESEVDALLGGKANTSHSHDGRYYTEAEVDSLLGGYAVTGHSHDTRYYTKSQADGRYVNTTGDAITGTANLSSGAFVLPVGVDKWA